MSGAARTQNIRETHAIVHVVRCFDDHEITHVEGSVDPVRLSRPATSAITAAASNGRPHPL
jgi:hypothetical protein